MAIPEDLQPYAGRWVARVAGRVAGAGATPDEARADAGRSQPTLPLQLAFVPEPFPYALPDICGEVRRALAHPDRAWLVGGTVRDILLGRPVHDLDLAVDDDGLAVARAVAAVLGGDVYALDQERGVGRVLLTRNHGSLTLDFARLRGADIYADLAGRDFTLNALAVPLTEPDTVLDPLRGAADLRAKVLRACSPTAIADDAIRGVRAVRLAAQLGFRIEPATRAAIRTEAAALAQVSAERQRDELIRCLGGLNAEGAVRALETLGLLEPLLPELLALKAVTQSAPHVLDVWEHSLATLTRLGAILSVLGPVHDVDAASDLILGLLTVRLGRHRQAISARLAQPLSSDRPRRWLLALAALLHDAAKPQTRSVDADGRIRFLGHETAGAQLAAGILERLRFSSDEIDYVRVIVANHMRPRQLSREAGPPSARAVYRFFRDTGQAGVDIVLLSLADYLAKFGGNPPPQDEWAQHLATCARLLQAYLEEHAVSVAPPALITGTVLMRELGLAPGPLIGRLLEAVREAQAAGEVADPASALALARRLLPADPPPPAA